MSYGVEQLECRLLNKLMMNLETGKYGPKSKRITQVPHTPTHVTKTRIIYLVRVTQTHGCTVSLALTAGTQYDATKN